VTHILVVEDEPAIAESVAYALGKVGHQTAVATCLSEAREKLTDSVRLVVLDLMLPDGSGFDFIDELALARSRGLAIIVLSSRGGESDRVRALEMGADDYVAKPFSPREVVARVSAVLRRIEPEHDPVDARPRQRLTVHEESRRAFVDANPFELTRVEFDLLSLLLSEPSHVFSRSRIIDRVWGEGFALSDRTIDSHVKALRKKIEGAGGESEWIETVRGVGYRCRVEDRNR
jgi:two-component system catabolic regulation response regulator CreB